MRIVSWPKVSRSLGASTGSFLLLLGLLLVSPQSAHAQLNGNVPGGVHGNKADTVFWQGVREGRKGFVANPGKQWGRLISGEYFACRTGGNCSERAVGFAIPIHQNMPAISEKQGEGAGSAILYILGAFFIAALAWAANLLVNLGREEATDASAEG